MNTFMNVEGIFSGLSVQSEVLVLSVAYTWDCVFLNTQKNASSNIPTKCTYMLI